MKNVSDEMSELMKKKNLNQNYQQLMNSVYSDPDVKRFLKEHQKELSDDVVKRSASKLYEFVNEKKKLNDGNENFAKGYQPTLVLSDHLIDVSYRPTQALINKQKQEQFASRIKSISMPKGIKEASLSNYDQTADRAEALEKSLDFIESYEDNPKQFQQALYLYGPFGVGKTYLLGAIANRLASDGFSTVLIHFPSFAVEIKNAIGNNQVGGKLDEIKTAPILMIDDIGADSMSSWIRDDILGVILEYRMQNELPTFFSSNFSMDQLEEEHLKINSQGDDEPLKAKRLMERIKFLSRPVELNGRNRRNK